MVKLATTVGVILAAILFMTGCSGRSSVMPPSAEPAPRVEEPEEEAAPERDDPAPQPGPEPVVAVVFLTENPVLGMELDFRISVQPAPVRTLTIMLTWEDPDSILRSPPAEVEIAPEQGLLEFAVETVERDAGGTIKIMIDAGDGYQVSLTDSEAHVMVQQPEEPGTQEPATAPGKPEPALPLVTISSGGSIAEGGTARFTVTMDTPPESDFPVEVSVTDIGNHLTSYSSKTAIVKAGQTAAGVSFSTKDSGGTPGKVHNHDGAIFGYITATESYTTNTYDVAAVHVNDKHGDPDKIYRISLSVSPSTARVGSKLSVTYTANGTGRVRFNAVRRYLPSRVLGKTVIADSLPLSHSQSHSVTGGRPGDRFVALYIDNIFEPDNLGFGDTTLVIVRVTR